MNESPFAVEYAALRSSIDHYIKARHDIEIQTAVALFVFLTYLIKENLASNSGLIFLSFCLVGVQCVRWAGKLVSVWNVAVYLKKYIEPNLYREDGVDVLNDPKFVRFSSDRFGWENYLDQLQNQNVFSRSLEIFSGIVTMVMLLAAPWIVYFSYHVIPPSP